MQLDFDAICISETSFKDDDIANNELLENYTNPFTSNTLSSKGGVAIFLKNDLDVVERLDLKIQNHEFETVWVEIRNKKSKNAIIGCTYRHPHSQNIYDYSNYIQKCMTKLNKEKKDVYLAGDFNIDLLKYDTNNKYQDFYNHMTSNGFLPMIIQPTRIRINTMSIIDNIYSNTFTKESISGNILFEISDHLSQFAFIQKDVSKIPVTDKLSRDYSNFNEASFLEDLSIQNWSQSNNVNDRYSEFIFKLEGCVSRHAPLKKLSKKEIKIKSKPWITPIILKKIKQRNAIFTRTKQEPGNVHLKTVYKKFRNTINRDLIKSKNSYYRLYFDNCKNDMKKTWKGINDLIAAKSTSTNINQLNINNSNISDPKEISNSINSFFVNVGQKYSTYTYFTIIISRK